MRRSQQTRNSTNSKASRSSRTSSFTSSISTRSSKIEKKYNIPILQLNTIISNNRSLDSWKIASKALVSGQIDTDDANLLNLVIKDLESRCIILEKDGYIQESQQIKKSLNGLHQKQIELTAQIQKEQAGADLSQKLHKIQTYDSLESQSIKNKLQELNIKLDNQRQVIEKKHEKEIKQLDADWKSESRKRRYAHTSVKLRELRRQESILFQQRKMDEYQRVKSMADELEINETENAVNRWESDYNSARTLLLQKQKNEIETFEQSADTKRQVILHSFEKQNDLISRKKRAIEIQNMNTKEQIRSWEKRMRNSICEIAPPQAPLTSRRAPRQNNLLKLPPLKSHTRK
ncbi:hypothetical protein TVAG_013680 [Trichomonas vaginalis G3]|uniref:Uncharacterized protein n=1 Tax=Trichomonas vaginalis (strain ATCC PRA-98 / G3) TaxID=412133 RepID=A2DDC4_TRIV3|nr:hypothetical protein TVAGG3_0986660 [Trichomonas vaginalis G3]EAY21603.1 hypothetical protein TVAG_013680 [Trichomonas vaginalis G3]KAI5489721.1 hypothetical protein TVAGG3_0986660 [Trichomonas vaginalis G3]|eukprot:XP_001582589.1 hypothetical protein [Trichomonas vaginalis G3]